MRLNPISEPRHLRHFPWATLGRSETAAEFFQKVREQSQRVECLTVKPRFAVLVVLESQAGARCAAETWESLQLQSYPHWEVWVAAPESRRAELAVPADPRFHWLGVPEGTTAQTAKSLALEACVGDWVGVLAVGDVLSPAALYQFAAEMARRPDGSGYYSHEVSVDSRSRRLSDFFSKREWSPETLWHWNAIGRFAVLRREGLFFEDLSAGVDEQLAFLRAGRRAPLYLVPAFLIYRRENGESVVPGEPERQAMERFLNEGPRSYRVTAEADPTHWRVTPKGVLPTVTAIVCFRDKAEMTLRAVESLVAVRGAVPLDIVLVDNDSQPAELEKITPFLSSHEVPIRLVHFPGPFNFGRMHNWAVREHARGQVLLLLNNDVRLTRGSLEEWAAWAAQPNMATVGIRLLQPNSLPQHSGIRAWFGGEARLARIGNSHADDRIGRATREVFANTFAASLVPRAVFDALGGMRETECANGFGDVAFCLNAVRAGYRNLFLGSVEGVHAESSSRGRPYEYWEEVAIEREFPELLQRLLREDLGLNRVPAGDGQPMALLAQALRVGFREHSRWLNPAKPTLKKWLNHLHTRGDTA